MYLIFLSSFFTVTLTFPLMRTCTQQVYLTAPRRFWRREPCCQTPEL